MSLTAALVYLAVGFVLLVWSADRLVAGASALARNFGVSALVVGITIVGFGTSAPEMVVSALASLEGNPALAVGNALGSNIANIGLILGLTCLVYPMSVENSTCYREIPLLAAVTVLAAVLMLGGSLSRPDGLILIAGLVLFLAVMLYRARRTQTLDPATRALLNEVSEDMSNRAAVAWTVVGLLVLPASAQLLVNGAIGLAVIMGVSESVIGLTIVALGTSLPELAAAMASALRKEDDLCIGNILGSNLFNLLGVLGIAALIHPMAIEPLLIQRDLPVMILTFLMLAGMALFAGRVGRLSAAVLLATYILYQVVVFRTALG
ncbi:MAG: calcium/sodium antiporter [Wenzhouxiangellaceae bacterium]|jgi:cation:H+ antiporter|nr:calcium/sodium antiporter [Wenzhouxiangellaceae bacterium]MBS3747706.1 calcium/sodium antiporter [Wenzhouxiangellaceae bacterium]MBS3824239.1 calcium/sodium antiporter [Wenzhouxiangellaceae bacterium]